jgi:long-chain acyl-CoA synthetase
VATESPAQPPSPWGAEVGETLVLGYPCPTFISRPRHLSELLWGPEVFRDREYLVQGATRVTFSEHLAAVSTLTASLRARDVNPGDRIVMFAANSIEWVIAFWSIINAGAIVVLGNAWWSQSELRHALDTVNPRLVFTDSGRSELVPSEQPHLLLADLAQNQRKASSGAESTNVRPVQYFEDDPAVILFTSGTTGMPKGAVLTHRGILATLQSLLVRTRRLPEEGVEPPPPSKALLSLPLFHIGGLQQVITPLVGGGTVVFSEGRFDPAGIVRLVEQEGISVWSAVPTMVSRVLDYLEQSGHAPIESLRTVGMGGSPVVQQLRERALEWFPNVARGLAVTYGLSEACGVLATGAGEEIRQRPGSVGRPIPTANIRIDNPDEHGVGEIVVRSPSVMLGYWVGRHEESETQIDPGPITVDRWLHTGDVGWIDQDDYLYVTDRNKDIVIRGGENIATPNVENRLLEHPAVMEAAVVGLPHPTLGEELGAVVVTHRDLEVSAESLAAFVAEKLAYFEVPTRWQLRKVPLPQNTTGKVLKRIVRDEWIEQLSSAAESA